MHIYIALGHAHSFRYTNARCSIKLNAGQVAAFIAETIQGVGGTVVLPDGYLKEVYQHVRKAGGVCIADEVQTGFGRLGTHYWGFQTQNVVPDIGILFCKIALGSSLSLTLLFG